VRQRSVVERDSTFPEMATVKTGVLGVLAGAGLLVGIVWGIRLGEHYYAHHVGDWRIGATAIGIAIVPVVGIATLVGVAWWLVRLPRRSKQVPGPGQSVSPGQASQAESNASEPRQDIISRLELVRHLRERELISDEELAAKRAEILDQI
jgi:hypothetical protein